MAVVTVKVRFKGSDEFSAFTRNVQRLVEDPARLMRLMRIVMRYSLLEAYKKRFEEGRSRMTKMEVVGGSPTSIGSLTDEMYPLVKVRIREVLRLITEESKIEQSGIGGRTILRIGKISDLDEIFTPTASRSQEVTGGQTPYKILWRHLEFGTGVYASPVTFRARGESKAQSPAGSWFYGPSRKRGQSDEERSGVHFRGSRAAKGSQGGFLRKASGLPYDSDALQFERLLIEMLNRQLGRV